MSINQAIKGIEGFKGESLTDVLAAFENDIVGLDSNNSNKFCESNAINKGLLNSALIVKQASSQIDVIIHASGILYSLPRLLEKGEFVESVSLGAGNTGKKFDLETNLRVAEFKFIDWQGGAESIRQNGIFKDFYELAEYETTKEKFLYVVGTTYPLKFFNGGRAMTSILSKQPKILKAINDKYGARVKVARDYYELYKNEVSICDVKQYTGRDV
ncbi:MAG: hypothetical protein COA96_15065 [SAR86 cluster bacterium]|uniref:Uncharacterized protein n=1 Tax=SAR86 cluster bacterium TaxID=2030880 RepID=A0A2A5ARJ1_9GAMM|nr:MAG: hypothetical protein COA96_15065 [SAR86 cluster bacterium]